MLIIVICFSCFYSENYSQATLQTPKFLIMIPKTLCIILSKEILKNSIFAKYDLPLIRLNTTGSGEKEKIVSKLNELLT